MSRHPFEYFSNVKLNFFRFYWYDKFKNVSFSVTPISFTKIRRYNVWFVDDEIQHDKIQLNRDENQNMNNYFSFLRVIITARGVSMETHALCIWRRCDNKNLSQLRQACRHFAYCRKSHLGCRLKKRERQSPSTLWRPDPSLSSTRRRIPVSWMGVLDPFELPDAVPNKSAHNWPSQTWEELWEYAHKMIFSMIGELRNRDERLDLLNFSCQLTCFICTWEYEKKILSFAWEPPSRNVFEHEFLTRPAFQLLNVSFPNSPPAHNAQSTMTRRTLLPNWRSFQQSVPGSRGVIQMIVRLPKLCAV